jgi:hypothetical protein
MSPIVLAAGKRVRRPAGCESFLTRRQAATLLGFASEFKVRAFERQGLLRSVRGPMRTAFYARPEVLALKARLAQAENRPSDEWTDADLIALLELPGQPRTALDLVTEARISIERAERVHAFWTKETGAHATAPRPSGTAAEPRVPDAPAADSVSERRGEDRLSRDHLIRELRNPDPRVRQRAFEGLRGGTTPKRA